MAKIDSAFLYLIRVLLIFVLQLGCVAQEQPRTALYPPLVYPGKDGIGRRFQIDQGYIVSSFEVSELIVPFEGRPRRLTEIQAMDLSEKAIYCFLIAPTARSAFERATNSSSRYFLFSGIVEFDGPDSIGNCPFGGVTIVEIWSLKPIRR